jgi:hypothetical protein
VAALEPFLLESLTSYTRRAARQRFYADTVSFLRAGGVDWPDRSRDPDLLGGAILDQVAAFLDLAVAQVQALTIAPYLARVPEQDRGSLRWSITATQRTRVCDRCVISQPYGRIHWRFPVVTECLEHRRTLLDVCRVCGTTRDRGSRRWERFGCGHHIHRSAGTDSRHVDLRVQQAVQAALGLIDRPPGQCNEWMLHAAIEQKGGLAEVEAARDALRDLWAEHRRSRLVWHRASRLLRAREESGERTYPTERPPLFAISPPQEKLSPEVLRQAMEQVMRDAAARAALASGSARETASPVGVATPAVR